MNCTLLEPIVSAGFILSLFAANFASWRMQKLAKLDGYEGSQLKLLLGDVALPQSVLSGSGLKWRKASVVFFVLLVLFGITIGVLNSNGSQCFGLNS